MTTLALANQLMAEIAAARKDPVAAAQAAGHDFTTLPPELWEGYALWWCFGIRAGSFLQAVIENDLMGAMGNADDLNRVRMFAICQWFYNHADGRATKLNAKVWGPARGHFGTRAATMVEKLSALAFDLDNTDRLGPDGLRELSAVRRARDELAGFLRDAA